MALFIYTDGLTLTTLGLRDSVIYLLNQVGWETFAVRERYSQNLRLTLEFLSFLYYDPSRGRGFGRGMATFRLFGTKYRFTHREMAELLGFPSGPDAYAITPDDAFIDLDLDYSWGNIIGNYHPEPHTMFSENIHNLDIRYFHKIMAHTLFGKKENITIVSKDKNCIMYCASQGRPVNAATFMLAHLAKIARETHCPIIIGGLITMIVDAIGLRYTLNHLHTFGGILPMHLNFCFNRGIIANLGPTEFELLIDNEVVRNFTLPNHEKTNIHNRANWFYNLEGQSKSPTTPYSPQHYENPEAIFPNVDSHASAPHHVVPPVNFGTAIHDLQYEVDFIKGEVDSL